MSVADYLRLDNGEEDPFANVDYIMRFESLANDFRAVCTAIGNSPPPLPQYNQSSHKHIQNITMTNFAIGARAVRCGDRAI